VKTIRQILEEKGGSVVTTTPDATVLEALTRMAERNIGALVVLDGGRLAGLMSERDYARKVVLEGRSSRETPVREIMTDEVVCVGMEQTVDGCMALMTERRFRHLPVVENDKVVGVISIGDVVKALIEHQQFTIDELTHYILGRGVR
jgi:CBS domain-containing protein